MAELGRKEKEKQAGVAFRNSFVLKSCSLHIMPMYGCPQIPAPASYIYITRLCSGPIRLIDTEQPFLRYPEQSHGAHFPR